VIDIQPKTTFIRETFGHAIAYFGGGKRMLMILEPKPNWGLEKTMVEFLPSK
jgi:hypothetical protein